MVVKSEASQKDMFDFVDNRFMVKGMGNIYYTHNNGHLANDPKLACMNFLSALEKIPKVIENHGRELEKVKRDVETYKAIASGEWKKEGELRKLKSELSKLDRKISLTINKKKDDGAKEQGVKADTSGEIHNRIDNGNDGVKVKLR